MEDLVICSLLVVTLIFALCWCATSAISCEGYESPDYDQVAWQPDQTGIRRISPKQSDGQQ